MAIVRSLDGRFFDIEEEILKTHEIKRENLPSNIPSDPGPPLPPPSGKRIQIVINIPDGSAGGPPQVITSGAAEVSGRDDNWNNWANWNNNYTPTGWSNHPFGVPA